MLMTWIRFTSTLTLGLLVVSAASAVDITPSQTALLNMVDVTTVFGASQTSTVQSITAVGNDGVGYLVNWDDTGEGFTRVVFQQPNVDSDWSAYDNFSVTFTPFTEDIGVKPFLQTGDGFQFFETAFTNIAVADGPTAVPLDLSFVANTDNVRQFGYQIFGPGGQGVMSSVVVGATPGADQYVPEPTGLLLVAFGLLTAMRFRR